MLRISTAQSEMKTKLISTKNKYWRHSEPLCGILDEWHGRRKASRIIGSLTGQPQPVQELIEQILERDSSPEAVEFEKVRIAWSKIVPQEYSRSAFAYYIKENALMVKVHDSCSLMELKMRSREMLGKLLDELRKTHRTEFPKISRIAFLA